VRCIEGGAHRVRGGPRGEVASAKVGQGKHLAHDEEGLAVHLTHLGYGFLSGCSNQETG
jgi:hypothetical protein